MTGAGRVFVAGHRGMLGHVVARVFEEAGWQVVTDDRRYSGDPDDPYLAAAVAPEIDVVVNGLGVTAGPRTSDVRLFVANALFPQALAASLGDRPLIHASTDCVFDGTRGDYRLDDVPDDRSAYGLSKRLGEHAAATPGSAVTVLRTSIVGPQTGATRGLLAWFLAQEGPVDGWTDHRWNGITTLHWAKVALAAATGDLGPGIHQPTTERAVSKYEMLEAFARTFDHPIEIRPTRSAHPIDRTLRPSMSVPPFDAQLADLRRWSTDRR